MVFFRCYASYQLKRSLLVPDQGTYDNHTVEQQREQEDAWSPPRKLSEKTVGAGLKRAVESGDAELFHQLDKRSYLTKGSDELQGG